MILPKKATSRISGVKQVEDHQIELFFRQNGKDGFVLTAPYFYAELAHPVLHVKKRSMAITCQPPQTLLAEALLCFRAAMV